MLTRPGLSSAQLDSSCRPSPSIQRPEETSETDPQAVARHLAAPVKVRQGRQLAQQGKLEEAIAAFRAAQQLVPAIDLNPETEETSETDPQAVARHLVARAKVWDGRQLAQQGKLEEAIAAFRAAQQLVLSSSIQRRGE